MERFVFAADQLAVIVPAAGHSCDLWERQLQKNLLLFVHKVDSSPVYRHDDIILGKAGPCEKRHSLTRFTEMSSNVVYDGVEVTDRRT